jgi:hypothetical protein
MPYKTFSDSRRFPDEDVRGDIMGQLPIMGCPSLVLQVVSAIHIFIAEYNLCDQVWIMIFHDLLSLLGRINFGARVGVCRRMVYYPNATVVNN